MRFIMAALLLAAAPLSPALAQGSWTNSERAPALARVADAVVSGRAQEAIDLVDPMLADYEKKYAGAKLQIFCVETLTDILAYVGPARDSGSFRAIDTGWCFALWAKGYALVDLHRTAEGLPFLERAAAMEPLNSQYQSELGNAYQELKQWDKALATFTRAVEVADRMAEPERTRWMTRGYRGMGFSLVEMGRWDEAEAVYHKALDLDPADQKSINELTYIDQNRPKERKLK